MIFSPPFLVCILPNGDDDSRNLPTETPKGEKFLWRREAKKVAELLKLLANEHRLLILCALIQGAMSVERFMSLRPNISLSALSQHLSQLKTAGILSPTNKV